MLVPHVPPSMQLPSQASSPTIFRRMHPRMKTACLACQQQRKKCDKTHPYCSACKHQGLPCTWPNDKAPAADAPSFSRCTAPNSEQVGTAITRGPTRQVPSHEPLNPLNLTTESTKLLQYYLCITAWQLPAVSASYNPLISNVLPAAKVNHTLMHAILAVSGAQLAYHASNPTPIEIATRQHYLCAIRGVRDEIANQAMSKSSFQCLSLVLAFICRHEVFYNARRQVKEY